jgi:hypothetical protein
LNICPETFNLLATAEKVHSKPMFIMSYTKFNAFLDMSHRGRPHLFKDVGAVADSPTGIHKATVLAPLCCQKQLYKQGNLGVPTGRSLEDSNQASVEAMQWVLRFLSIGHDGCYCEHPAQQGSNVPAHNHARTTSRSNCQ